MYECTKKENIKTMHIWCFVSSVLMYLSWYFFSNTYPLAAPWESLNRFAYVSSAHWLFLFYFIIFKKYFTQKSCFNWEIITQKARNLKIHFSEKHTYFITLILFHRRWFDVLLTRGFGLHLTGTPGLMNTRSFFGYMLICDGRAIYFTTHWFSADILEIFAIVYTRDFCYILKFQIQKHVIFGGLVETKECC